MKIGIEAQRIFRHKKHGMDIYALELIRNLQAIDQLNQYYIFVRPGEDKCLEETANFKIIEIKALTYADWEQIQLPLVASKLDLDVLHCTSNTAPIFAPAPLYVTIHDIIYLNQAYGGGSWYQKLGHYYRKWIVPIVFEKAKKVFTVSNFEKREINEHFGETEKVEVIYNGVSDKFYPQSPDRIGSIRVKYHLPYKFIFFLGNTAPKKNLPGMLKAYAQYIKNDLTPLPLVIAEIGETELKNHLREIEEPDLFEHITLTGYIPQEDLPALYSAASLFMYPSLRESFGIPIIEAMICSTPVITSNTSSMPEIGHEYADYIDPNNPSAIADKMSEVLTRNTNTKVEAEKLDYASSFKWQATARKMTNFYFNKNVDYVLLTERLSAESA
ncbi:glycosyltransferase family 4 protein [Marinoscillum pacificum]|uniref:glycosyltransferase family 4 protein n=1 Tax=Marinoscillum pacificum TaxID=392723 RepID=UPI0021580D28|nr:glycosyltransferase family 1 protein [Marinoscillum pacificum]